MDGRSRKRWSSSRTTKKHSNDGRDAEPHGARSSITTEGQPFSQDYPTPHGPDAQREEDFVASNGPSRKIPSSSRVVEPRVARRSITAQDYPTPYGSDPQQGGELIVSDGPKRKSSSSSRLKEKGFVNGWDSKAHRASDVTAQDQPFSQGHRNLHGPGFQVNFISSDNSSGDRWSSSNSAEDGIFDEGNTDSHTTHTTLFSGDPECLECEEAQSVEYCPECQEDQQEVESSVPQGPGVDVDTPSPMMNNVIIETIQSSSDSMVNQLNRRCDALENKLDQQYFYLINQSEIVEHEDRTYSASGSTKMLQNIIVTVQDLHESLDSCHQDFMGQTSALVGNVGDVTQKVQRLQNKIESSIGQLSQLIINRFDQLEQRMMHQEKKFNQFLSNRQGISNNAQGDDLSFEDRLNSFMTTVYQTSQQAAVTVDSMSKDLAMLRERLILGGIHTNPTDLVGDMQQLKVELTKLERNLEKQVLNRSVHIERVLKEMPQSIALLITNLLGQSDGSVGKQNPELSVKIMEQFKRTNEYIRGTVGNIESHMTELQSSLSDIRRVVGNSKQVCSDESPTQSSLVSILTGVIQRNNQNLEHLVKSLGTELNQCCVSFKGHPTESKDIAMIQNKIGGISSNVTKLLAELKRLYNVKNDGKKEEEEALRMRQSEWAAMMKAFQAERSQLTIQLGMYKKALDARQCPAVGQMKKWTKPPLTDKKYKVTRKPLRNR